MDQNFHLIEKYFQGKLDKDELQLFNQKLQQDPSFEQEFRDMKLIRDAVKETSRIRALDILQNAEANLTNQETTKINVSMKRLVSIAASLLIVATVSYFAFSGGTGALTGEEIVANYYEPYTNIVMGGVRGDDGNPVNTLKARAYNAYDIRDFSTSADLFKDLLTSEKIAENYLYSGIANLEAGNLELAKSNFNTAMNDFSTFKEQAQWYLALTLFKDGAQDEAISNISSLIISNSSYKDAAVKILADLNLSLDSTTTDGKVYEIEDHPLEEDDSPDGSVDLEGQRKYQLGKIMDINNRTYRFFNDYPISGLGPGDDVKFIVLKANKNGKNGLAVIVDVR
ncbi:MAG: hypothetical protein Roseis2KO_36500 [Roseivirga sp.]